MTLRQGLGHADLSVFVDKIQLRRDLLPSIGVKSTPSYYMSNTDFNLVHHVQRHRDVVVKPSHLTSSRSVYVIRNRTLFLNAWNVTDVGRRVSAQEVQYAVNVFRRVVANASDGHALHAAPPGVIVEELILGIHRNCPVEDLTVQLSSPECFDQWVVFEFKCFTVWGEVVFVQVALGGNDAINRDEFREVTAWLVTLIAECK